MEAHTGLKYGKSKYAIISSNVKLNYF